MGSGNDRNRSSQSVSLNTPMSVAIHHPFKFSSCTFQINPQTSVILGRPDILVALLQPCPESTRGFTSSAELVQAEHAQGSPPTSSSCEKQVW